MMTRPEMEARRLSAIADLKAKSYGQKLAEKYHVSRTTIKRWRQNLENGKGLASTRAVGRPRFLEPAHIVEIYQQGPRAFGFDTDRWSTRLFAAAIEKKHGIRYDKDHAGRLLHKHTPWRGRRKAVSTHA